MHNKVVAIVHWCIVLHIYRALIDWMSWNQNQSDHGDKIIKKKKKRKKPVRTQNKKHNGSKKKQIAQNAETRPIKSRFVLVLQLISWEVGANFLDGNYRAE